MHDTLGVWDAQGIGFVSARQGFDTRTALGRLLLNLLASLAEFELGVLSERVRAGMDRARRAGGAHRQAAYSAVRTRFRTRTRRHACPEFLLGDIGRTSMG